MDRHTYNIEDVLHESKNTVKSIRGMGYSGEVQLVMEFRDTDLHDRGYKIEYCPYCEYDRVLVSNVVNPVHPTPLSYDCMNPNCNWSKTEEFEGDML